MPAARMTDDMTAAITAEQIAEQSAELLRALAGPQATLRDDQLTAIDALVRQRRRVFVCQATGWGKSAVYWIAAALRRRQGSGPALVISPLLALMRDQVAAASRMGLSAVTLNSANVEDWPQVEELISADGVDVLLISPERLNAAGFRARVLPQLAGRLGLLVVDEAHTISDWGHDFRPDYRRVRDVLAGLAPETPVLATTATANERVTADVAGQIGEDTLTLRGSLDRTSLALDVISLPDAAARYAWIAATLRSLDGSGIVYTLTVAETTRLADWLSSQGIASAAYSGGTDRDERERIEAALHANQLKAVVATSSLGMGFDKADLAWVINLGAPASPIAYYQQVGRAGRGVERAVAVLLPGAEDARIWEYFATVGMPAEDTVRQVLDVLAAAAGPMSIPALEAATPVRRTRLETMLKILDVDGAVTRGDGGWTLSGQPWVYDSERYDGVRAARRREQDQMRAYTAESGCLMRFLRGELDDPSLTGSAESDDCGRCARCRGDHLGLPDAADPQLRETALRHLRSVTVPVAPRKMWPSGLPDRRGMIPAGLRAEEGRALAYGADAGWGDVVESALSLDQPLPDDIIDGLVRVLAGWGWSERPSWVCPVPSRRHPTLVADLAQRLGAIGRLPVVAALERVAESPYQQQQPNSVAAASGPLRALRVTGEPPPGPVLLVDDEIGSGWTATVAAALLREAGAGSVYPLAVWKRP
jgi:ATP-dependent DNA helicase RecQ